ncbi:hypothetical protein GOBAR_AA21344 [Gossypium barbadense]|uniref:Uncharacterized protein n=1 Tax=Gossypium barbadense TaxID=3634 RepID=A0A2P5X7K4_GOSBA|nr:hypothetical protein GOBAR_AA21344 [Gossypium barbadense]
MELVDDEDMETMVTLFCGNQSYQNAPIQLFFELVYVEPVEYLTPLHDEHGVQDPCMVVPISYVDSQSTVHGFGIDLNTTPETDPNVDDGYDSSDPSDHEVDCDSDPNMDKVSDDIDDEDANDDGNVNASSVGNPIRCIVILKDLGAHMSLINPDAAHVAEFPKYPDILPTQQLVRNSEHEELLVGQKLEINEDCVFVIKRYSMNVSVYYKVILSKLTSCLN